MLNLAVSMILCMSFCSSSTGSPAARTGSQYAPQRFSALFQRATFLMTYYYFSLGCAGIVTYVIYRFLASPLGYYLKALADNEIRIEYSGNPCSASSTTPTCFPSLGGPLRGVGPLPSGTSCQNTPSGFNPRICLHCAARRLWGAYRATFAIAFEFIRTYANKFAPYARQMTLGIIMLLIILLQPGGIWAMYESLIDVRVAVQKESSVPEPIPILQPLT